VEDWDEGVGTHSFLVAGCGNLLPLKLEMAEVLILCYWSRA
jgi:hypothetical protein